MADVQPNVDFAQQVLAPLSVAQDIKAQAWEAYHNSTSLQDFTQQIGALNLPQEAKADLWEGANMRFNGAASAPPVPRPVPQMQESALGNAYSVAQTGSASNAAPASRGASLQQQTAGIENTTGGEVATGALNGALQTVHTGLAAGSRIVPGVQNIPFAEPKQLQSQGTAENIGEGLEGIGEFFTGDEAFKGLSLADRLGMASKVAKLAEAHPVIAKIIEAGMNAVRSGAVSGAQSGAHGQDMATGAALGAAGSVVGDALGMAKDALFPRTTAALNQAAEQAANTELNKAKLVRQFAANSTVSAARSAAENAGAEVPKINFDAWRKQGVPPLPSNGVDSFRDAASSIRKTFDPVFDKLREASGGVLDPSTGRYTTNAFDDAQNQIRRAKKVIFSSNPASTDALKQAEQELKDGNDKLEQLFSSNGQVSKEQLATAKAAWKTASTLDELHDLIDKAFTEPAGVRGPVSRRMAEVNPAKYVARVNTALDRIGAGNLRAALGDEAYANLMSIRKRLDTLVTSKAYAKDLEKIKAMKLEELRGAASSTPVSQTVGGPVAGGSLWALLHFGLGMSNPASAGLGAVGAAMHYLYTHPDTGVQVLKGVAPLAQPIAQAGKQYITHVYNPATDQAEPVQ